MPASLSAPSAAYSAAPATKEPQHTPPTTARLGGTPSRTAAPAAKGPMTVLGYTTREFMTEALWTAATFTGIAVLGTYKAVDAYRHRPAPPSELNKEQMAFLKRVPSAAWVDDQSRSDAASGVRRLTAKHEGHTITIQMFAKQNVGIVYQIFSKGPVQRFGFEITSAAQSSRHLGFARVYIDAILLNRPLATQRG